MFRTKITLQRIAPHRTTSHRIAPHLIAPHGTTSHRIAQHYFTSCRTASHHIAPHRTASHRTTSHHIAQHRTASHHIAPHCTALHRTAPHRTASCRIAPQSYNTLHGVMHTYGYGVDIWFVSRKSLLAHAVSDIPQLENKNQITCYENISTPAQVFIYHIYITLYMHCSMMSRFRSTLSHWRIFKPHPLIVFFFSVFPSFLPLQSAKFHSIETSSLKLSNNMPVTYIWSILMSFLLMTKTRFQFNYRRYI